MATLRRLQSASGMSVSVSLPVAGICFGLESKPFPTGKYDVVFLSCAQAN